MNNVSRIIIFSQCSINATWNHFPSPFFRGSEFAGTDIMKGTRGLLSGKLHNKFSILLFFLDELTYWPSLAKRLQPSTWNAFFARRLLSDGKRTCISLSKYEFCVEHVALKKWIYIYLKLVGSLESVVVLYYYYFFFVWVIDVKVKNPSKAVNAKCCSASALERSKIC